DVVVRVAEQAQRDTRRQERAEGLAGGPAQGDVDRAVRQAGRPVALDDLVAQPRADGAVDVADRQVEADRDTVVEGGAGPLDEGDVQALLQPVVLGADPAAGGAGRRVDVREDRGQVQAGGLPVAHGL